jgi:hypothetical protein
MLKQLFIVLIAATLLAACSDEPSSAPEAVPSAPASSPAEVAPIESEQAPVDDEVSEHEEVLEQLAQDPDALREAMRDPEQREALMAAMRERREARRAEQGGDSRADREAMREEMRARRAELMAERGADGEDARARMRERMLERNRWWADEDLQDSIGLADAQAEALTQAQLQFEERREALRQQLGDQQRALMTAIRDADRSGILTVIEERARTQQSMQALELDWWRSMLNELSDEQLTALGEQNPRALMRPSVR